MIKKTEPNSFQRYTMKGRGCSKGNPN